LKVVRSCLLLSIFFLSVAACDPAAVSSTSSSGAAQTVTVTVSPSTVDLAAGASQAFAAAVSGTADLRVTWRVAAGNGTIDSSGNYTAPATTGDFQVTATSIADSAAVAVASVHVRASGAPASPTLAAVPDCQGSACSTPGGRGGVVYKVNSLGVGTTSSCAIGSNRVTKGTCTLDDCLQGTGLSGCSGAGCARTCVFYVAGTIVYSSGQTISRPYLTVAGQTAPAGGIQIKAADSGGSIGTNGSIYWPSGGNMIWQYLRMRSGPCGGCVSGHCGCAHLSVSGAYNLFDHNSMEWGMDKSLAFWPGAAAEAPANTTLSYNIEAEGLASHSTGSGVGTGSGTPVSNALTNQDWHHNMFITLNHRLPQWEVKSGRYVNNYIFNYAYGGWSSGGSLIDIIGNVWDWTGNTHYDHDKTEWRWQVVGEQSVPGGTPSFYMVNNFGPNNQDGTTDNFSTMLCNMSYNWSKASGGDNGMPADPANTNWQVDENGACNNRESSTYSSAEPWGGDPNYRTMNASYKATSPVNSAEAFPITATTLTAPADLRNLLAPQVGAYRSISCSGQWVANRDALDDCIIAYTMAPASSPGAQPSGPSASACAQSASNPIPYFPNPAVGSNGSACADSDGNGLPDAWEVRMCGTAGCAGTAQATNICGGGWTNLECYMYGLK
jgi:hypothetical protein